MNPNLGPTSPQKGNLRNVISFIYRAVPWLTGLLLLFSPFLSFSQAEQTSWQAQEDHPYLQEFSTMIKTDSPISSIKEYKGDCFLIMNKKLFRLKGDKIESIPNAPDNLERLIKVEEADRVYAISSEGLFEYHDAHWEKRDDRQFVDIISHLGTVYAATQEEILKW